MAASQPSTSHVRHVAVFPPATHCVCKLDADIQPATAKFQGGMDDCAPAERHHCREEEDPERWDGMS